MTNWHVLDRLMARAYAREMRWRFQLMFIAGFSLGCLICWLMR